MKFESITNPIENDSHKIKVAVSKYRFFMVLLISFPLAFNGQAWMGFSSVNDQTMTFFNITQTQVDLLGILFLVAYCVSAIPCVFLPDSLGLKWTIIIGCSFNFMGSLLRIIGTCIAQSFQKFSYFSLIFGNVFFGFAMSVLYGLPSTLTFIWFPSNERTLSTSIPYMFNAFGVGIGFLFIFLLMSFNGNNMALKQPFMISSSVELILNILAFLLAIFIARDCPPFPPSLDTLKNKESKQQNSIKSSIIHVFYQTLAMVKSLDACLAIVVLVFNYCCYVTIFLFLKDILEFIDKSNSNYSGYIGSIGVMIGGLLSSLMGYFIGSYGPKKRQWLGLIMNILPAIPLIIILSLLRFEKKNLVSTIFLPGFHLSFSPCFIPIGCEILADITWPIDPIISSLISLWLGNILGSIVPAVITNLSSNIKIYVCLYLCIGMYIINLALLFKPFTYKRDQLNQKTNEAINQ